MQSSAPRHWKVCKYSIIWIQCNSRYQDTWVCTLTKGRADCNTPNWTVSLTPEWRGRLSVQLLVGGLRELVIVCLPLGADGSHSAYVDPGPPEHVASAALLPAHWAVPSNTPADQASCDPMALHGPALVGTARPGCEGLCSLPGIASPGGVIRCFPGRLGGLSREQRHVWLVTLVSAAHQFAETDY